jgi:hypothetical protein
MTTNMRSSRTRVFHMAVHTARLIIVAPPSLKAAIGRASRRLLMTPSAFVRAAIVERLEREPKPVPRQRSRDAASKATPPPVEASTERQAAVA